MKKLIILLAVIAVYATSSFAFTRTTGLQYTFGNNYPGTTGFFNAAPTGVYVELNSNPTVYPKLWWNETYITCTLQSCCTSATRNAGQKGDNVYPWSVEEYVTAGLNQCFYQYTLNWYNPGTIKMQSYRISW